ncbi:ankyrin repeat protein (macronuclear) [Tetrahymena thermophila SB210]|uniref:Ankyrin repeat protein n=1 Tax=Tetrahymena thermophila (strain SB210) TaxID=312017 RepID=I7MI57_TETTS|nr:ankyrin repeat protein [Tetrahymena thermophila SB210]EAS03912.2 ankyrin repeat protein [Tetrahymena thermophila SB210]|eukprot:XP_001024157.2 ankyrin repeat protein [Tetrahymena thermophila SB210]
MIREKLTGRSPKGNLKQLMISSENLNALQKMQQSNKITTPSQQSKNEQNNGNVRIEKSLKKIDSSQKMSLFPPSISLEKSKSTENPIDRQIKDKQISFQCKSLTTSLRTNQDDSDPFGFGQIKKQHQTDFMAQQLKNINLTSISIKNNFNQQNYPQIEVFTSSFIEGESNKNQIQNQTEKSNPNKQSPNLVGFSLAITKKEYTHLSNFVNAKDWKKITKLELSQNKLQDIPYEIFELSELRSLKLDNNYIKSIPDLVFDKFTELREFSISNNLVKYIPVSIQKSQYLTTVDFGLNHIEVIPEEIFNLPQLSVLNLTSNDFEYIPSSIIKVESTLKEFSIDWFRYANPPMNITQNESAIQILIAAVKKDLYNSNSQKNLDNIRIDNLKMPCSTSVFRYNSQTASQKNLSNGDSNSIQNNNNQDKNMESFLQNIDFTNQTFSFLKFLRAYSKVFDLYRVVSPESGGTLVHQAVYNEDVGALQSLLNYDFQQFINPLDKQCHSPLSLAIKEEQYYCAKILIYRGADVNIGSGFSGSSCLLLAVGKLQYYLVKDLIDRGANINHLDKEKNSCMHILFKVFENNPKEAARIGDLLLENFADPNILNQNKWSPLHIAAKKGYLLAIQYAFNYNKMQALLNKQDNKSNPDFLQKTDHNYESKLNQEKIKILFKIYQKGGEEKMNILHISCLNCFTDIVEYLILKENYNFTIRNRFDRTPYSFSQRHSTISKLLKRWEVRLTDFFINQDTIKVIENKMYDCQDDDQIQINPFQKSKAYNFYDQINQNSRLSVLNNSQQNQNQMAERSLIYINNQEYQENNNKKIEHSNPQLQILNQFKHNNNSIAYFNSYYSPYQNDKILDINEFKTINSENHLNKKQTNNKQSSKTASNIEKNYETEFKNQQQNYLDDQFNSTHIKKTESLNQLKEQTSLHQSCFNSFQEKDNQHYLGSFIIQSSLQAFRKSREDFQKYQNKMYPIRTLPQHQQNKVQNLLESFSNDNLNSESALNASDELATINNYATNNQQNQSQQLTQYTDLQNNYLNQNQIQKSQISTNLTHLINQKNKHQTNQAFNSNNNKFDLAEIDFSQELVSEEQGVKASQIFSWTKLQPKLIQDKLQEEKNNNKCDIKTEDLDSLEESSIKQLNGNSNPKIFQKSKNQNLYFKTNCAKPSKLCDVIQDTEKLKELLEESFEESLSSCGEGEQNIDELQENFEESLNESFSLRTMPYSPNNLKHIQPILGQLTPNDDVQNEQNNKYKKVINSAPQPIKIKKNYTENIKNVFKSNLSTLYNQKMIEPTEQAKGQNYIANQDMNNNEKIWNYNCFQLKTQKKIDQLLQSLKNLDFKIKNQEIVLNKKLESLSSIKDIESQLKGMLKELLTNNNFKDSFQIEVQNLQQSITSAITQFNLTINQIYLFLYNKNQQLSSQIYNLKMITNSQIKEIKLEKDWVNMQRSYLLQKIQDFRVLQIFFQQLFPQNNVLALYQQLDSFNQSNSLTQITQSERHFSNASFSSQKRDSFQSSFQIMNTQYQPTQLNQNYDECLMLTNPLYYYETVQRVQQQFLNPSSKNQILNETQLMQTLPTEEEYDSCQIEQPSIRFTQYNLQKPKVSSLQKRFSFSQQIQ